MRKFTTAVLAIGFALAGGPVVAQQRQQSQIDLQAAIRKEAIEGDLKGAIKQYAAVVAKHKSDRAVTAMALVHMAECFRKMGDAESRKLYEQVVKDYADQKDAVALARARLGGGVQTHRQTNTLIWSGPKVDPEGSVSFDGRYFSFTDWDSGDLAVREIATGQDRRITNTGNRGTSAAEGSTISRDGKQIAFGWWEQAGKRWELRVANRTGEPNVRRLYYDPDVEWVSPRDWSPDGKSVAVMISRTDRPDAIGLVSITDGSFRTLRSGNWVTNTAARIFFSPDGRYLGYDLPENSTGEPRDLFVFDITADREIPVAVRRGQDIMMGWSPDGKRLLFESDRSGALELWALPFGDGKPQGAPELLKSDLGAVEPLGVTQSGAFYYSVRGGGRGTSSLYVGSFDSATGKISSPRDVAQDYPQSNSGPRWSADGKYLAYISQRGTSSRAVSIIVIRSMETKQVIRELPNNFGALADWAPDGQSLLGLAWFETRYGALRMDIETGEIAHLITEPPSQKHIQNVRWSPDGKTLFYSAPLSIGAEYAFFQRNLASGTEKELVRRPHLGGLNPSPDGKYLATPSVDPSTNSRTLLLIPTDGSEAREVLRVPSGVEAAQLKNYGRGKVVWMSAWAPDSQSLLARVHRSEGQVDELWRIPLVGEARKLDTPLDAKVGGLALRPDGKQIAYVINEPTPVLRQIWALENFLTPTGK